MYPMGGLHYPGCQKYSDQSGLSAAIIKAAKPEKGRQ